MSPCVHDAEVSAAAIRVSFARNPITIGIHAARLPARSERNQGEWERRAAVVTGIESPQEADIDRAVATSCTFSGRRRRACRRRSE